MQTQRSTARLIRLLIILLLLASTVPLGKPSKASAQQIQQRNTLPLSTTSCGSVHAATYPAFDGAQQVSLPAQHATQAGAVLADEDGMTILVNGQMTRHYEEVSGNVSVAQIQSSDTVSITTSSGPDNVWVAYTAGEDFRLIAASLGDAARVDGVYEQLDFHYISQDSTVSGCILGTFNDTEALVDFSVIDADGSILWHESRQHSQFDDTLDLLSFSVNTQPGKRLIIRVSVLITNSQLREDYLLVGMSTTGAMPTDFPDQDGDGNPDPSDPDPSTPRSCSATMTSSSMPFDIVSPMYVDVSVSGDCGRVLVVSVMPSTFLSIEVGTSSANLTPQTINVCFDSGNNKAICDLSDDYTHYRFHVQPKQQGLFDGAVTLSLQPDAFEYAETSWEIGGYNLYLPVLMR